jgi:hypothetical protein
LKRTIEASTTIRAASARVCEVLLDDPGSVLSEAYEPQRVRARRFIGELSIELGAGAGVHQEVTLQLGVARTTEAGLRLPLRWEVVRREDILPAFDGELEISEDRVGTRLTLRGAYSVPLGVVGWLADRIFGRRLAQRSLRDFVDRLAARLDSEVDRRVESTELHLR